MAYWVAPIIKGEGISQEHLRLNVFLYHALQLSLLRSYSNRHFTLMMWNAFSFQYHELESNVGQMRDQLKLLFLQRQWPSLYHSKARNRDFQRAASKLADSENIHHFRGNTTR